MKVAVGKSSFIIHPSIGSKNRTPMATEAGQSFVVLKDLGENQCVVFGRNSLQGDGLAGPEVVFFPSADDAGQAIRVSFHY